MRSNSTSVHGIEGTTDKTRGVVVLDCMSTKLTVEGMTCGHCEQSVEDAVRSIEGVESVSADRITETVTVEGDVDTNELVAAIDDAGYTASA